MASDEAGDGGDGAVGVVDHIVVGEAQERDPGGGERVPLLAVLAERLAGAVVLVAVDLDSQPVGFPEDVDLVAVPAGVVLGS